MVAGKHKSGKRNDMSDVGLRVGDRVRYFAGQTYHSPRLVGRSGVVASPFHCDAQAALVRWDDDGQIQHIYLANLQRLPARAVAWCNIYGPDDGVMTSTLVGFASEDQARRRAHTLRTPLNAAPIRIEYDMPPASRAPLKPGDRVKDKNGVLGNIIAVYGDAAWVNWDRSNKAYTTRSLVYCPLTRTQQERNW